MLSPPPSSPLRSGKLLPDVARTCASVGESLLLSTDRFWYLVRGEVVVYRAGRPVELWRAPRALDLAGTVSGERSASFVAATEVEVNGHLGQGFAPEELARELARENAALWTRIEADARRDDDTFLPWARPVPGPWHFRRADAVALVVQGDPARIRASLPRGVSPLPGTAGRYILALTRFEGVGSLDPRDTSQFVYHEVTPFLPVWSGLRGPGAFIPELYPDAWMAVILGREIHGFPKRTARIGFHEAGGELLVDRRLALRVRWSERREADPHEVVGELTHALTGSARLGGWTRSLVGAVEGRMELGFSALVHKRIGASRSAGRTLAIDEIVRVPVKLDRMRSAARLIDLEVDIPGGPGILHGEVVGGWRISTGLRFDGGSVERPGKSR